MDNEALFKWLEAGHSVSQQEFYSHIVQGYQCVTGAVDELQHFLLVNKYIIIQPI